MINTYGFHVPAQQIDSVQVCSSKRRWRLLICMFWVKTQKTSCTHQKGWKSHRAPELAPDTQTLASKFRILAVTIWGFRALISKLGIPNRARSTTSWAWINPCVSLRLKSGLYNTQLCVRQWQWRHSERIHYIQQLCWEEPLHLGFWVVAFVIKSTPSMGLSSSRRFEFRRTAKITIWHA